jgi:hypothetical protein
MRLKGSREPWAQASTAVLWTAHLTWITVVLFVVSFIVMAATFAHVLGGLPSAPPKEVPQGVVSLVGWTDRLPVLSAWAWITTVAWGVAVRFRKASTALGAKGSVGRLPGEPLVSIHRWASPRVRRNQERARVEPRSH